MRRTNLLLQATAILFTAVLSAQEPLTIAESSGYTATSTYSDVMDFILALGKKNMLIRVETLCTSGEGRKVPLIIAGDPVPSSPSEMQYDGRAVIYIQANIHAGEVEGKEAALMLLRDILDEKESPYLKDLILLIAPVFNADGNERISVKNRPSQNGPEKGVGVRYNSQNLDLNRDAMKLESPEFQGLLSLVLNRWDPALLVDCHTTNGSYHTEPVTYIWQYNPNGERSLIKYMSDSMIPFVQKQLSSRYGVASILYGNFMDWQNPEKGWSPESPEPHYLTHYVGLRNRFAILNENYTYADYRTRVWGCYYFLRSVLDYCSGHAREMKKLIAEADRKTITRGMKPSAADSIGIEFDVRSDRKVILVGYEMEVEQADGRPRLKRTDKTRTYTVPFFADYFPKRSVSMPFGYLIPLPDDEIRKILIQHGIVVETLAEPETLKVEAFRIREMKQADRLYQGHYMNEVKGAYTEEIRSFPEGTLFVGMAQKLANLASYLLEPESRDGLLTWNFLDRYLVMQWERGYQTVPVYRLMEPVNFSRLPAR